VAPDVSKGANTFEHPFARDTYLTLDFAPSEFTERVIELRRKYDPIRARYPVEITVVGSSGLGGFSTESDPAVVFRTLSNIVARYCPRSIGFAGIRRFPETAIYWLQPSNPTPFVNLQQMINSSGLTFNPIAFPFTPHCTLVDLANAIAGLSGLRLRQAMRDVLNFEIPTEPLAFDCARLYRMDERQTLVLLEEFRP
jgi:2'-5' RNA ligase